MSELFSPDSIMIRMLNRLGDAILLSLLFVVTSLPIVTIGASTTALYYTAMRGITGDDGYVFKYFMKSFKQNFKQSTIMWILNFVILAILGVDTWFWVSQVKYGTMSIAKPMAIVSVVLLLLAIFIMTYLYPVQAKFDNTMSTQVMNSFILCIRYFPTTLLITLCNVIIVWAIYYNIVYTGMILIAVGFGAIGYFYAYLMLRCFKPFLEPARDIEDEEFHVEFEDEDNSAEEAEETVAEDKPEDEA